MTHTIEGTFNPAFHFLGLIQKAMADGVTRHCVLPGSPEIYLVPSEQAYYTVHSEIETLQALCRAAPFDLSVELTPDWRPASAHDVQAGRMWIRRRNASAEPEMAARPLSELLWYATLCASEGQLLHGCRADTPVRLKRCPDFSQLFHRPHDPMLAAFMFGESAPLTAVAEETRVPLPQVFDFYNACAILGLIDRGNVFDAQEYFLGLLEKTLADRQMRRCVLPGHSPLFLVPAEGKYYTEVDAAGIDKYCAALMPELEVSLVDSLGGDEEEEVVQIGRMRVKRKKEGTQPKLPARPLSELQFRAASYPSQGRLLAGYDINTPIRLKRWPDAALVGAERHFFALAAFMSTNAASLPDIAEATRLPLARVIDFHNGCAAIGLLEHQQVKSITTRKVDSDEREMYRKISNALNGLKAGHHVEHVS